MRTTTRVAALAACLALSVAPLAPQRGRPSGRPPGDAAALEARATPGLAWFGVWEDTVAEAERTGKPILLFSAAPQCRAVPGMW